MSIVSKGTGRFRQRPWTCRSVRLAGDIADALDQDVRVLLLENDAGATALHQALGFELADPGSHYQNFSLETGVTRQGKERAALLQTEIYIEKDDVYGATAEHRDAFVDRGAFAHDFEILLARQQPGNGLAE
jgi:hypothetical protein